MGSVAHHIEVEVPAERAYAWWQGLTNIPLIMSDVKSVTLDDDDPGLAHWKMKGPIGIPIGWDTRIVEEVPNTRIAWATVDSARSLVKYSGAVDFHAKGERTDVEVTMTYEPPGGAVGMAMAKLLADPQRTVEQALAAFKRTVEGNSTG